MALGGPHKNCLWSQQKYILDENDSNIYAIWTPTWVHAYTDTHACSKAVELQLELWNCSSGLIDIIANFQEFFSIDLAPLNIFYFFLF